MVNSAVQTFLKTTVIFVALVLFVATPMNGATVVDFVRDVRPILEDHCDECHGAEKQKSGLRLDVREAALAGGESKYAPIGPVSPQPATRSTAGSDHR